MAQKSSFFNAIKMPDGKYDRTYNASDWAEYFSTFLGNGIAANPSTTLEVQAGTGMKVIISPGVAFINGYRYCNTTELTIDLPSANATYPMICSIVVELNLAIPDIKAKVLSGIPSSKPVAPTLTKTQGFYQLQLATIEINAGMSQVNTNNISDTRSNPDVCGYIKGLFGENDFGELEDEIKVLQRDQFKPNGTPHISGCWTFTEDSAVVMNSMIISIGNNTDIEIGSGPNDSSMMNLNISGNSLVLSNSNGEYSDMWYTPAANAPGIITFAGKLQCENEVYFGVPNEGYENFGPGMLWSNIAKICCSESTLALQNAINNNNIFSFTLAQSGTDTMETGSNLIVNVGEPNNLQFNGRNTFNIANQATGNITCENGEIAYTISYWQLSSTGLYNNGTQGGLGVMNITLTPNGAFTWGGTATLSLSIFDNIDQLQLENLSADFFTATIGSLPASLAISATAGTSVQVENQTYTSTFLIFG